MSLPMVSSLSSRVSDLATIEGRHDRCVQEASVRLLLTSGGVTNTTIRDALTGLLGKPIADSSALCIPTAMYGHPMAGPGTKAWQFISGNSDNPKIGRASCRER